MSFWLIPLGIGLAYIAIMVWYTIECIKTGHTPRRADANDLGVTNRELDISQRITDRYYDPLYNEIKQLNNRLNKD
jgi:hypothetical protein